MKIKYTLLLFFILLTLNLLLYAHNQSSIHSLDCSYKADRQEIMDKVDKFTPEQIKQPSEVTERLEKLESRQAIVDGDMNVLKLQQKLFDSEWKEIFQPMQKYYTGRK